MSRQGEHRIRTTENVKDFWNQESQEWGEDPRVTIRDHYFRLLEIGIIQELLQGHKRALDIGCGSGFSTLFYSEVVSDIIGVDIAENMISCANRFISDESYFSEVMKKYSTEGQEYPVISPELRFETGNIVELNYPDKTFDAVIVERVIINLPDRKLQEQAIAEATRVLQPGGKLLLMEVFQDGHNFVDKQRQQFNLPILEKYWHNLYLEEEWLHKKLAEYSLSLKKIIRPVVYQFLTKIVHPLVVLPGEPDFLDGFNRAALEVGKEYLDYSQVEEIGLEKFLNKVFRPQLEKYANDKLRSYDSVVLRILKANPSFDKCTHQVLYVITRETE